jgi:N-acetyl-anhydromuramoyl-L-alanine amidase
MIANRATGWLEGVAQIPSDYYDARPEGQLPELIVIHGISLPPGQFGGSGIVDLFTGRLDPQAHPYYATIAHLRVSAHFLIRREGTVIQFVSVLERAWHAGLSEWQGRSRCNDFSIGIELEGVDDLAYSDDQYWQLASLVSELCRVWPTLSPQRMVGHSDIAPDRKSDPGAAFEWPRLLALCTQPSPLAGQQHLPLTG